MPARRAGGHRQKRARQASGDVVDDEAVGPDLSHSPLATGLLKRWAAGSLTAVDVQDLANLAMLSGCTDSEVEFLASMGSRGQRPGNISRALYRKYLHDLQLPEPELLRVPFLETRGDRHSVAYTDLSVFMPHDWVYYLSHFHPEEFDHIFGTGQVPSWWQSCSLTNPKFFQNPILDQEDWGTKCIPLCFHGDGARFQERDSLVTVSMKGLLGHQHMLLAAVPKLITCSTKQGHTADTWEEVWKHLCWSFAALMEGIHPAVNPSGEPFEEGSYRHTMAGKPLTPAKQTCIVWSITGDLDYYSSALGFPYHSANQFCWHCAANRGDCPWNDFRPEAAWRATIKTPLDFLEEPPSQHVLFTTPGISTNSVNFDMMHVLDLGITQHCIANSIFTLVFVDMPGSRAENFGVLWQRLQEIMIDLNLEDQPTHLNLNQCCDPKAPWSAYPNLSGLKAAESKSLLRAMALFCRDFQATPQGKHRKLALQYLVQFYDICEAQGWHLSQSCCQELLEATDRHLLHYSWLAKDAASRGHLLWSVVPKHHFFPHLALGAQHENPRLNWTYSGESFVGEVSRLAFMALPGKPVHELSHFLLDRWRIGLHIALTRGCL